jgi:Serine dehydrogenase proteinase
VADTIKADGVIEFSLNQLNEGLSQQLKTEVIAIRSPIWGGLDDFVRIEIEKIVENTKSKRKKLPKLTVLFETTGGAIEVVERISNVFRNHFHEVNYVVPGYAYSAGTVLVLSGDNIYMDYYSVLGPIDPQIEGEDGKFIPGMGYLYMYEELVAKSRENEITNAELLFLTKRFDPAVMFLIQQAKNHSEDLIKEWLPKYKFKHWKQTETKKVKVTPKMKRDRAAKIAEVLGDASKWHSHGRGITMRELEGNNDIKLKIEDFGKDKNLSGIIRQYYDLFVDYGRKTGSQYAIHTKHGFTRVS